MLKYVLFVVAVWCGCLVFFPVRSMAETTDARYLPLTVGNRWVYESSEGSAANPVLETWEVVRQEGQAFAVRIQQTFVPNGEVEEQFAIGAEGVQRQLPASVQTAPPLQVILKMPPVEGLSWLGRDGRYTITALDETLTVPAGTFPHCVEVTRWRKETQVTEILTYAPGVGIVQREEKFPVIGGMGSDFETLARVHVVLRLREWRLAASSTGPTP
jgi:hypothetical protein